MPPSTLARPSGRCGFDVSRVLHLELVLNGALLDQELEEVAVVLGDGHEGHVAELAEELLPRIRVRVVSVRALKSMPFTRS